MSTPEYITINGTRHALDKLSDAAKVQVANVQIADNEIARLQQQLAIAQTARNAYFQALLAELKNKEEKPATARKPKAAPRKKAQES